MLQLYNFTNKLWLLCLILKFSNILDATIFLSTCLQAVITKGTCLTISLSCFSPWYVLPKILIGLFVFWVGKGLMQSSARIKSGCCSKSYKILSVCVMGCYDFLLSAAIISTQNFFVESKST